MPGMGKANAAVVGAHCYASYPNIKLALIVGICGAVPFVPNTSNEIILGDIFLSNGVIQYDLGRPLPDRFVRKNKLLESLSRPNMEVRGLLGKLEDRRSQMMLSKKMISHLSELQALHPSAANDKLFEASYLHRGNGETCDECGCDGNLVLSRCAIARLVCSLGNAHDAAGRVVCLDVFYDCVLVRCPAFYRIY
jgi:hypothetical protein